MSDLDGRVVMIGAERYFELLKIEDELQALKDYGVDNWGSYGEHRDYMCRDEDLVEDVLEKIVKPVER